MIRAFEQNYTRLLRYGLVGLIGFAVFARAAHDLWSASVLFAGLTLLTIVFLFGRFRDAKPIYLPLALPAVLLLVAFAASLKTSYDVESTWFELWGWFFTWVSFYLFINLVENDEQAQRFFLQAGLWLIPLFLICVWQQFTKVPLGYAQWGPFRYGHWEIQGTLINSIVLAGFTLHWTLYFWAIRAQGRLSIGLFAVCLAILFLARSSWAFLALLLGLLLHYRSNLLAKMRQHKGVAIAGLTLGALLLGLLLSIKWQNRPVGLDSTASYQVGSRWTYWQSALKMSSHIPWTGIGLGGYATAYPYFKVGSVENTRFAHSFPLQLLAETGLIGMAAFLFLIGAALGYLRRKPRDSNWTYAHILGMVIFFSLMTIHMDFLLNRIMFFLFLAATVRSSALRSYSLTPLIYSALGVGFILISAFWLNLFAASRLYTAGIVEEKAGRMDQAEKLYRQATDLESFHADSYWRLYRLYVAKYAQDRSPQTLSTAQSYLHKAVRYRKDVRFLQGTAS